MKKFLLFLTLLLIFFIIYTFAAFFFFPNIAYEQKVKIEKGSSISSVIDTFNNKNYLKPKSLFLLLIKIFIPKEKNIKAGTYLIPPKINNFELLKGLFTGEFLYRKKVFFPEGLTIYQYASILKKELNTDSVEFINTAKSSELARKYDLPVANFEGYLYPATYFIDYDAKPIDIIEQLHEQFESIWKKHFAEHTLPLNMNKHQVITLASIVEAESPRVHERPRIAGVYINRLSRGMPLQADPTVQYALKKFTRLFLSDLSVDSPYNTYKYVGLPPTPINSPSKSSIDAVLNYEKHNYLYFVAKGDGSGEHNFAQTYNEHLSNVAQFRKNLRNK